MHRAVRAVSLLIVAAVAAAPGGCVQRTISITSEPSGALVWVNDREIGRTPVDFDFLYYGTYDVRLEREGYEPLLTYGEAEAPWWETVPLDLVAELTPADLESHIHWHYELQSELTDREALIDRAQALREAVGPPSPEEAGAAAEPPASDGS